MERLRIFVGAAVHRLVPQLLGMIASLIIIQGSGNAWVASASPYVMFIMLFVGFCSAVITFKNKYENAGLWVLESIPALVVVGYAFKVGTHDHAQEMVLWLSITAVGPVFSIVMRYLLRVVGRP